MRARFGIAAAAAAALAWASPALAQGAGAQRRGGEQAQGGQGGAQGQGLGEDLRKAMQELHAANQAEIALGETAQRQAQSPQVKQLARRMVDQHQKNDRQLEQVAQQVGAQLEGNEYQRALEESREKAKELRQKRAAEFDRAYVDHMVKDHEENLKAVHDAAMKAGEERRPQLAQVLGQAEATLHEHHALAQQTRRQVQGQGSTASGSQGSTGSGEGSADAPWQRGGRDAMGTPATEENPGGVQPKRGP